MGGLDDPDPLGGEHGIEGSAELGVAVADEELGWNRTLREVVADVAGLLGHPVTDGLGRDTSEMDDPGVKVDEEPHREPSEQDGVDGKEIARDQALGLGTEELRAQVGPDRRGAGSMPWRLRIAQTLDGAMEMPMVASSPQIRR